MRITFPHHPEGAPYTAPHPRVSLLSLPLFSPHTIPSPLRCLPSHVLAPVTPHKLSQLAAFSFYPAPPCTANQIRSLYSLFPTPEMSTTIDAEKCRYRPILQASISGTYYFLHTGHDTLYGYHAQCVKNDTDLFCSSTFYSLFYIIPDHYSMHEQINSLFPSPQSLFPSL